jgi:hypothetical protein
MLMNALNAHTITLIGIWSLLGLSVAIGFMRAFCATRIWLATSPLSGPRTNAKLTLSSAAIATEPCRSPSILAAATVARGAELLLTRAAPITTTCILRFSRTVISHVHCGAGLLRRGNKSRQTSLSPTVYNRWSATRLWKRLPCLVAKSQFIPTKLTLARFR